MSFFEYTVNQINDRFADTLKELYARREVSPRLQCQIKLVEELAPYLLQQYNAALRKSDFMNADHILSLMKKIADPDSFDSQTLVIQLLQLSDHLHLHKRYRIANTLKRFLNILQKPNMFNPDVFKRHEQLLFLQKVQTIIGEDDDCAPAIKLCIEWFQQPGVVYLDIWPIHQMVRHAIMKANEAIRNRFDRALLWIDCLEIVKKIDPTYGKPTPLYYDKEYRRNKIAESLPAIQAVFPGVLAELKELELSDLVKQNLDQIADLLSKLELFLQNREESPSQTLESLARILHDAITVRIKPALETAKASNLNIAHILAIQAFLETTVREQIF
jgi:hypothetical protein